MKREPQTVIQNALSVYDAWLNTDGEGVEGVGRFIEAILECVDWSTVDRKTFAAILTALIDDESTEDLRDAIDAEAEDERRLQLECTIGVEIGKQLERCGVNAYQAEVLAHKAIGEALEKAKAKASEVQP